MNDVCLGQRARRQLFAIFEPLNLKWKRSKGIVILLSAKQVNIDINQDVK